jgi:hypothetical protein
VLYIVFKSGEGFERMELVKGSMRKVWADEAFF